MPIASAPKEAEFSLSSLPWTSGQGYPDVDLICEEHIPQSRDKSGLEVRDFPHIAG